MLYDTKYIILFVLVFILLLNPLYSNNNEPKSLIKKLIVLSIDGFPAYYLESKEIQNKIPNLRKFFQRSKGGRVQTVNPSLTFPAHTSMITGMNPEYHGIYWNREVDPFGKKGNEWVWYIQKKKVKSLMDYARDYNLTTASVYWPVSASIKDRESFADWNIPQIWKYKTFEDESIIREYSTPGLYDEIKELVGESLLEISNDAVRFKTGLEIFLNKQPNILLLYTTDLDTIHHKYGPYSKEAIETLEKIDSLFGEFIKKINLYNQDNLGIIVVSDHGFLTAKKICRPNQVLANLKLIHPKKNKWDYYFHSTGGMAILVQNPNKRTATKSFLPWKSLKKNIERKCPGVYLEKFKKPKSKHLPQMEGILWTKENIYFSSYLQGEVWEENQTLYVHGYSYELEEMDTILYYYPPVVPEKKIWGAEVTSIRDVFFLSCDWLGIVCRVGDRKNN